MNQFIRTEMLFGSEPMKNLAKKRVIVFGIGGVGGHVAEALVRSGIGAIDIVDDDKVVLSNLNRQIFALHSTIGKYKVDAAGERLLDINPECKITKHRMFFLPETADSFNFSEYDYVVDCIDTVSGKIEIILRSKKADVPVISSMGAGNKIDPTLFQVADISKTSVCPLARVMRRELKKRGVEHLKCVFSTEKSISPIIDFESNPELKSEVKEGKKQIPASNAFVPSVAGLIIAGEVLKDLTNFDKKC